MLSLSEIIQPLAFKQIWNLKGFLHVSYENQMSSLDGIPPLVNHRSLKTQLKSSSLALTKTKYAVSFNLKLIARMKV